MHTRVLPGPCACARTGVCACGTSCRGRFVSHWPRRRAALFRMQICRRGALSPSMECGSGTVNLCTPRNAAAAAACTRTHTPELIHIYCGIFSASRVTLLVNNLFCVVFSAVRKKKNPTPLFLTLQNFTPWMFFILQKCPCQMNAERTWWARVQMLLIFNYDPSLPHQSPPPSLTPTSPLWLFES